MHIKYEIFFQLGMVCTSWCCNCHMPNNWVAQWTCIVFAGWVLCCVWI